MCSVINVRNTSYYSQHRERHTETERGQGEMWVVNIFSTFSMQCHFLCNYDPQLVVNHELAFCFGPKRFKKHKQL